MVNVLILISECESTLSNQMKSSNFFRHLCILPVLDGQFLRLRLVNEAKREQLEH
jgi:hypothetical protein